ncbi:MAG: thioredoxin-disulfide reductase [Deltaproteobacteria bacterium]|nr:MAG: thioredoxin-disulfide reductase [Deltaproteobacteria bacterium]
MPGDKYDVIIIGGGPAGLTAGLYASRARLATLLIEELIPGGQAAVTHQIDNYPGFPGGISGEKLMESFKQQAESFGLEIAQGRVERLTLNGDHKGIRTDDKEYTAKAAIIATGSRPNNLGVPGEEKFKGKGVSYCATCDGAFFRDAEIAVVGGGDSAIKEALFLTKFARKINVIHRRSELRAEKVIQEKALGNEKIEFVWDSVVEEIGGEKMVEYLNLKKVKGDERVRLKVEGVFVYIGNRPNSDFLQGVIELDEKGYVKAGDNTETSSPGIFAAGDVRTKLLRQVATAVGDGATAAMAAEEYISRAE